MLLLINLKEDPHFVMLFDYDFCLIGRTIRFVKDVHLRNMLAIHQQLRRNGETKISKQTFETYETSFFYGKER
jgi:hypothetical protein